MTNQLLRIDCVNINSFIKFAFNQISQKINHTQWIIIQGTHAQQSHCLNTKCVLPSIFSWYARQALCLSFIQQSIHFSLLRHVVFSPLHLSVINSKKNKYKQIGEVNAENGIIAFDLTAVPNRNSFVFVHMARSTFLLCLYSPKKIGCWWNSIHWKMKKKPNK